MTLFKTKNIKICNRTEDTQSDLTKRYLQIISNVNNYHLIDFV